jgi:hypothetical protein
VAGEPGIAVKIGIDCLPAKYTITQLNMQPGIMGAVPDWALQPGWIGSETGRKNYKLFLERTFMKGPVA